MELILMRHGTTQGNLERRFIGTLDVPLLPRGGVGPAGGRHPCRRWSTSTAAPSSAAAAPPSCCGPAWR